MKEMRGGRKIHTTVIIFSPRTKQSFQHSEPAFKKRIFKYHESQIIPNLSRQTSLDLILGLTFQRQRLPNPKLLQHNNKQSDNNNDGDYFHALHVCLASDRRVKTSTSRIEQPLL